MEQKTYTIGNMDCANCARELQDGVARLEGVEAVEVNFATGKMRLSGDVPYEALKTRVEAMGKTILSGDETKSPYSHSHHGHDHGDENADDSHQPKRGGVVGFWDYLVNRHETRLALTGGGLVALTVIMSLTGLPEQFAAMLYTIGMGIAVYPIAESGINTFRFTHQFSINLLMTIAAAGAVLIGEHLEAATVIFLFAVGEALEGYTADRARDSIRALMALKPTQARRISADGVEQDVMVEALQIDDVLLVKPGERIPMDGVILTGVSGVNQAPITGESTPVAKTVGDTIYAGSINGDGALTMRVTHLAEDNTLSRIVRMVEEAQSHRAPSQRLVDSFAARYTPAVVILAGLVAFVPPLLFSAPFYDTPDQHGWLYRALSMLVIACPCALVISTPVTVISGITAAARRGVLIKGGAHLEMLSQIKAIAFDKTGTLTRGQPQVTGWRSIDCPTGEVCEQCDDVLALASAVERRAAHPLAAAVVSAAESRVLSPTYAPAETVETLAGRGVRGQVGDAQVTLGSHRLFDEKFPHPQALCDLVDQAEANGQTTMLVAEDDRVRGFIALADEARPESRSVIASLNALGLPTVMLTGDNAAVAGRVGREVGVSEVRAELLPGDKVDAVKALTAIYGRVAMVGDGINDTPALAAASLGIAMGGAGSPQALETADVALLADDLTQLPFAIRLARFARHLIVQNVVLSFGVKAVFLALAAFGLTSLWLAILADVGMALLVTLNGMRPLRFEQ